MQILINTKKYVSDESRKQISSLFTSGIDISQDKKIFSQLRIQQGQIDVTFTKQMKSFQASNKMAAAELEQDQIINQKKRTKENEQFIFNQESQFQSLSNFKRKNNVESLKAKRLFVFHPTYMVTSQIFKKLISLTNGKEIITGHMGISKTISVFLFWKLTRYIDQYRFNPSIKVPQKYFDIPKIFYWSIGSSDIKEDVLRKIFQQTQHQFLTSHTHTMVNLSQYYRKFNKNLNTILVGDQINEVSKRQRILQVLSKKINKSQEQINQIDFSKSYLKKIKQIFTQILPKFDGILYLSSMGIEDQISKVLNLSNQGGHQKTTKALIQYSSLIFKNQSIYELIDYFIFEFQQRVQVQNGQKLMDKAQKKILRNKIFQHLDSNRGQYFLTPRVLRKKIDTNKIGFLNKIRDLSNERQQINFIFNKFIQLVQQQTQQYGKLLNDNFLKNDQNDQYRLAILFDMYNQLIKIDRQANQKGQKINQFTKQIQKRKIKWSSQLLNKYLDKRIFYFQEGKQSIQVQIPPKLALRVLQKQISNNIRYFLSKHSRIFQNTTNKADLGKIIERFFFLALLNRNADFKILTPSYSNIKFDKFSTQQCWFQSIPIFNRNDISSKQQNKVSNEKLQIKNNKLSEYQTNTNKQPIKKQQRKQENINNISESINLKRQKKKKRLQKDTEIRRSQNYQFLQSFIQHIEDVYLKEKQPNSLFLPANLKSPQIPKKSTLLLKQKLDKNNKCIDAVLFRFVQGNKQTFVQLWALDLTIGTKAEQKLKNFIKQFIGFEDRFTTQINVQRPEKIQKQINIYLYYYVLDNKDFEKNIQSQLNQQFGQYIKFKAGPNASQYEVTQLEGRNSCLLKKIGCLNYQKNIKFLNPTQENALVFQEAVCQSIKLQAFS